MKTRVWVENEFNSNVTPRTLNGMLYVLAANYEDARTFAYQLGYHYTRMVNVDRLEKLMGLRNVKLHVIRGAENRKNYGELIQEAKIRGLEIETHNAKVSGAELAKRPR